MVDWLISILLALSKPSLADTLIGSALAATVGWWLVVLIHEMAHAVAARMRGLRLDTLTVGDGENAQIRIGRTVFRFGRVKLGGLAGFVTLDPDASPGDVIVIALAGPLANLLTAPLFAGAAQSGATGGPVDVALWLVAVASAGTIIDDLIPRVVPGRGISDGAWILYALAVRAGLPLPEPEPEPEPPTAPADSAADADQPVLRPPFVVAIALLVLLLLVLAGPPALILVVPILVVIGLAYLMGAHRVKI